MATAMRKRVVRSEEQAFKLLAAALADELEEFDLVFENWPILSISVKGPGYDSTITADIAESLVKLQNSMNRAYARAVHETGNARSLTAEEKRAIKFKAKVKQGSSLINVDLGPFAQKLAEGLANKMDSTSIVITVISVAILGAGVVGYKAFLKHKSEDKKVDAETQERTALSAQETARLKILAEALAAKPVLKLSREDFDAVKQEILRATADAQSVTIQDVRLTGEEARVIALTPRTESEAVQLNGHYRIHKIDWQQPDQIRLSLYSKESDLEFLAAFKAGALDDVQKEKLKTAEWDRKPLYMAINGTRLRGEISSATIISVEWPKDKAVGAVDRSA